jgi:NAD(P)-dependent dehydrogenase (short-subunit alcohol dehydrogenase family)
MASDARTDDPLFSLEGRVAVVTGGSRGLGLEIAQAYAEHGAQVVVASRDGDRCKLVADEITERTGRPSVGIAFHAGHWGDCDRLAEEVYERLGRVDVLVNNAGVSPLYASLTSVTEELMNKVLAVNFTGPFRLATLIGERMAAGDGGSIINVSSIGATRARPTQLPYAGAKAALNALTVGLAQAYAPKVRVNSLVPGPFLTDVSAAWDMDDFERNVAPTIPLGRAGRPSEIIGAALYLASDASTYTTGSALKVDGGSTYTLA